MALVYYVDAGNAAIANDEPANPPLDPPFVAVSQATYDAEVASLNAAAIAADPQHTLVHDFLDNAGIVDVAARAAFHQLFNVQH